MLLDDLVAVIKTLRKRIDNHRDALQENETRTRIALIDPLLTALGWDVSNPALVLPEYNLSGQRADYGLLSGNGKPTVILEAKRLGESLERHRMQTVNYANMSGVPYAGLTDGNHWELYDVFKPVKIEEKCTLNIAIAETPPYEAALKLLLLWRPNMASGKPVAANEPLAGMPLEQSQTVSGLSGSSAELSDGAGNWISLAKLEVVNGQKPPLAVRFPDGDTRPIKVWRQVLVEVAEWLVRNGKLTSQRCPILARKGGSRFLINTNPVHKNGRSFFQSCPLPTGLFLEADHRATTVPYHAGSLLTELGVAPESVEVRLE